MATPETTCYIAVCDGCKIELETDYIPHFPSASEAIETATEWDWVKIGDKLYCENCGAGKGVPCSSCDDLVAEDGDRCEECQEEDRRKINAPS